MFGKAGLEACSATIFPPVGVALRYDVGKGGVAKIRPQIDVWSGRAEGIEVLFQDGSARVYSKVAFSYDSGNAARGKGSV